MKRRGVTVLETLLAATVFTLAVLVVLGTFSLSLRYTQHSRNIGVATNVGQEIIEQLRLGGFDNVTLNASPTAQATSALPSGYTKTYVSYYQGNDKIKEVTVKIYWNGRPESMAISLTTLIGQGGIGG
jgi:Tfp pilus assembly protein PilV